MHACIGGKTAKRYVMSEYALSHQLTDEQQRLMLMSALLDPFERARLQGKRE